MLEAMPVAPDLSATSVLGLVLTLDPASPGLPATLATLHAHPDATLEAPRMPYVALSIETADTRSTHAWLETLPGVLAVDVAFVEVSSHSAPDDCQSLHARRTRDPRDDSPVGEFVTAANASHSGAT